MLQLTGVSKYFGAVRAVNHVSLEVKTGEVVALLGDNGAGKSTLVKIISGVYRPDAGEMWLADKRIEHLNPTQARASGIETVHQHLALCDNLDAPGNVILGREPIRFKLGPLHFINRKQALREAQAGMDALGVRLDSLNIPVRRFSGGQRQAVSIARSHVGGAKIVIFDEPTAALGVGQKRATLELIKSVAGTGVGVLLISHNLEEVFGISDRIVVLRLGEVVLETDTATANHDEVVTAITGIRVGSGA